MTSYADRFDLRSPSLFKLSLMADALDGLLVNFAQFQQFETGGSILSTMATALTSAATGPTTLSVAVGLGELVLLTGEMSISHNTLFGGVNIGILRDNSSSNLGLIGGLMAATSFRSNTGGVDYCVPIVAIDGPGVGTHTYSLGWSTNVGTVYSGRQQLSALVFQNS